MTLRDCKVMFGVTLELSYGYYHSFENLGLWLIWQFCLHRDALVARAKISAEWQGFVNACVGENISVNIGGW